MVGKGEGEGEGNILKLENQIAIIKYVILFTNVIIWMIGACIFGLCLWLRFDPGIQEWLEQLNITEFYVGVYILIFAAIVIMVVPFVGCFSALQENTLALLVYIGTQVVGFIFGVIGSAILLSNGARDSNLQPKVRESMRRLIMNAHYEPARQTLAMIQESISCCGADGAKDYLQLNQPLPSECRDTVTGNPFYYGCVNELTWFFEQRCTWIAGLVMAVCFFHVINTVLSVVLIQALKKEEEQSDAYKK